MCWRRCWCPPPCWRCSRSVTVPCPRSAARSSRVTAPGRRPPAGSRSMRRRCPRPAWPIPSRAPSPATARAAQALTAYPRGVSAPRPEARRSGDCPSLFGLTGVYPPPWTPIDSLVLQGVLTQELDYTTTPLDYAILERTLGPRHTMAWFPTLPPPPPHSPPHPPPPHTAPRPPPPPPPT